MARRAPNEDSLTPYYINRNHIVSMQYCGSQDFMANYVRQRGPFTRIFLSNNFSLFVSGTPEELLARSPA
jgi:hypothetical protein